MNTGEQNSFLKAYEDFSDAIFRYCYFRLYHRELAKDLAQETFIKTWEYIAKGGKVQNIRAFLYRVARNLIIDESRKKRMFSLDLLREKGFDPAVSMEEEIQSHAGVRDVMKFLSDLEPKYREVIILRFVEDMSPKEIAEAIGESENNISVRLHRAIKKVRELIEKESRHHESR